MNRDLSVACSIATEVAIETGKLQIDRRGQLQVDRTKAHSNDFVTDLDLASEKLIVSRILSTFPDDAIEGEEGGNKPGTSGWQWVIDPIDGTRSFMTNTGQWTISIVLCHEHLPFVAVVHDPVANETFTAIRGEGAYLNGSPIRVSDSEDLTTALMGMSYNPAVETKQLAGGIVSEVLPRIGDLRRLSAAIHLAYVAAGRLECGLLLNVKDWDIAAGVLLVHEAGGWSGDETGGSYSTDVTLISGKNIAEPFRECVFNAMNKRS